jgi:group I intron endonuclease
LRRNIHHSIKLQRAWEKYGEENFIFEVIIYCKNEDKLSYEQKCIDLYDSFNSGYNVLPFSTNCTGRIISEETRRKISISNTGKKASQETKDKMSKVRKGRKPSKKMIEKLIERNKARTGHKASAETREKMSKARKNFRPSEEHRKRISEANFRRWEKFRNEKKA